MVRGHCMAWTLPPKRILVPFAFSRACLEAIGVARTFVHDDERITALHVVPNPANVLPGVPWSVDEVRERARQNLAALFDEEGMGRVRRRVVVGVPADEIVAFAETGDLIAKHGHDVSVATAITQIG